MPRNRTLAAFALALLCAGHGCYGSFTATRTVYKRNARVEGRPAREGVFLALTIIPVYEVCLLADLLIFNTIELFGGENPIAERSDDLDSDTHP